MDQQRSFQITIPRFTLLGSSGAAVARNRHLFDFPWGATKATKLYSPILLVHIGGGGVGLLSGAVALSFRKGSRPHAVAGNVFFVSMLIASAAGAYLALRKS